MSEAEAKRIADGSVAEMEAEPTARLHKVLRHNGQFWALPQADRGYADEQGAVLIAIENLAAAEAWSTDKTSTAVDLGRITAVLAGQGIEIDVSERGTAVMRTTQPRVVTAVPEGGSIGAITLWALARFGEAAKDNWLAHGKFVVRLEGDDAKLSRPVPSGMAALFVHVVKCGGRDAVLAGRADGVVCFGDEAAWRMAGDLEYLYTATLAGTRLCEL